MAARAKIERIYLLHELPALTGYTVGGLRKLQKRKPPEFPDFDELGPRRVGLYESKLARWQQERKSRQGKNARNLGGGGRYHPRRRRSRKGGRR